MLLNHFFERNMRVIRCLNIGKYEFIQIKNPIILEVMRLGSIRYILSRIDNRRSFQPVRLLVVG